MDSALVDVADRASGAGAKPRHSSPLAIPRRPPCLVICLHKAEHLYADP